MIEQNDSQLINRILEGDISGYSVLVDRYKDLAFTLAYRILGNHEDAEEVAQDAFVKAYHNLAGFRQQAKFSTWFFRIIYNTAISKKRLKKRRFLSLDDLPALPVILGGSLNDESADEERGPILEKALLTLTEDERTLITLYYINDSSVEEIHAITGLSKSNVKIKLFRARKKLQEYVSVVADKAYI